MAPGHCSRQHSPRMARIGPRRGSPARRNRTIRGNHMQSYAIICNHIHSEAIRGNQGQSEAIRGNQRQSVYLHEGTEPVARLKCGSSFVPDHFERDRVGSSFVPAAHVE